MYDLHSDNVDFTIEFPMLRLAQRLAGLVQSHREHITEYHFEATIEDVRVELVVAVAHRVHLQGVIILKH